MATKPPVIKQSELQAILDLRLIADTLARELKQAQDNATKAELLMMDRVERSAPTQPGELSAGINVTQQRRPAWKECFARALGPEAVDKVVAETVPTEYKKLVIMRAGKAERA